MSEERFERMLELLLAAEVRNLAIAVRSRDAKRFGDDSINRRPVEQYLPEALDRLQSVVAFLRDSAVLQQVSGSLAESQSDGSRQEIAAA